MSARPVMHNGEIFYIIHEDEGVEASLDFSDELAQEDRGDYFGDVGHEPDYEGLDCDFGDDYGWEDTRSYLVAYEDDLWDDDDLDFDED